METIAVLENLRSSQNVGSIFRTADAIGLGRLYLCGTTPGPKDRFGRENTRLTKASLGAEKTIPFEHCDSSAQLLTGLQKDGWSVIAFEAASGATSLNEFDTSLLQNKKIALVFGSEPDGLSKNVLTLADHVVAIPMHGKKSSLNVAVAFGVAVYGIHWLGR